MPESSLRCAHDADSSQEQESGIGRCAYSWPGAGGCTGAVGDMSSARCVCAYRACAALQDSSLEVLSGDSEMPSQHNTRGSRLAVPLRSEETFEKIPFVTIFPSIPAMLIHRRICVY